MTLLFCVELSQDYIQYGNFGFFCGDVLQKLCSFVCMVILKSNKSVYIVNDRIFIVSSIFFARTSAVFCSRILFEVIAYDCRHKIAHLVCLCPACWKMHQELSVKSSSHP